MRPKFVKTANVDRFLAAAASLDDRGAPEASIIMVQGNAGHGKSRAGQWWAVQHDAVFLRLKAAATPHWVLTDLVTELGEAAPAHSCEGLFAQATGMLAKNPRPIIVDEVENAFNDIKTLESIRDISDLVEIPLVLLGREWVWSKLRTKPQFRTRIGARADFLPATMKDVQLCFDELCEVPVTPEVIEQVFRESEGHIRDIVKAIANVERIGKRNKGQQVALDHIKGKTLVHDFQTKAA
ncbi:MAG: hypothetical protein COA65_09025 [Rhodospirillaceae bacterium]|nr:MAG: hypothetical protein COA65_09025 [Rhodospirillaceae bacterium]